MVGSPEARCGFVEIEFDRGVQIANVSDQFRHLVVAIRTVQSKDDLDQTQPGLGRTHGREAVFDLAERLDAGDARHLIASLAVEL
jgi:hypothetical protein